MFQVEQEHLGLSRVQQIVDTPQYKTDGEYYRAWRLPERFENGLYRVDTQPNDYSCSVLQAIAAGRLQGIELNEECVIRGLGVTKDGVDPDQMHEGMTRMGIHSYLIENMTVPYLKELLYGRKYSVIIDYQEPECSIEEKICGDAGHYAMAYAIDCQGFVLLGESSYEGSSRIHETELPSHWYDVSLRTGKWFYGTGIVVPITYRRKWYPSGALRSNKYFDLIK